MAENFDKLKQTQAPNELRQEREFTALKVKHFTTVSDRRAMANFQLDKQMKHGAISTTNSTSTRRSGDFTKR